MCATHPMLSSCQFHWRRELCHNQSYRRTEAGNVLCLHLKAWMTCHSCYSKDDNICVLSNFAFALLYKRVRQPGWYFSSCEMTSSALILLTVYCLAEVGHSFRVSHPTEMLKHSAAPWLGHFHQTGNNKIHSHQTFWTSLLIPFLWTF